MDWLGGSGKMSIKQGGRMVKGKKGKPITHTLSRQGRGNQFNYILLDGRLIEVGWLPVKTILRLLINGRCIEKIRLRASQQK